MAERALARPPTIFAMGGGGFTMEPENPALDKYVLSLAPWAEEPRICFLPTASGDPDEHIARFRVAFADLPCEPRVLSIFRLGSTRLSPEDEVLGADIVYVGGGSMRSMLAIWREYELDRVMRRAWQKGVVLAGLSAGAMCWFTGGVTKSAGSPMPVRGLGFLPHSLSVHDDGEPERAPVYRRAVADGELPAGWAADDGVGLRFSGTELTEVVTSRPGRAAWRVEAYSDEASAGYRERRIEPRPLVGPESLLPPSPPSDIAEMRALRAAQRR